MSSSLAVSDPEVAEGGGVAECDGEVRKKLVETRDRYLAFNITYADSEALRIVLVKDEFTRTLKRLRGYCEEEGDISEGLTDLRDCFDLISLLKESTELGEERDLIRGLEEEVTRRQAEEEEKLAGLAERIKKAEEALKDSKAEAERWKEKAEESEKALLQDTLLTILKNVFSNLNKVVEAEANLTTIQ